MSIVISIGPVPAKLDSVKYLGNRFKGGLGLKTAKMLKDLGQDIIVMKWKYLDLDTSNFETVLFDDIVEYKEKIMSIEAGGYILSAAVANLMPIAPWKGKFPSHKYSVGESFNVEFCIAPRIIDEIKKKYPRAALIGYKLLDGDKNELLYAARKTLRESKANLVFANTPSQAKTSKYMLTQDGLELEVSFDKHVYYINKLLNSQFYKTEVINEETVITDELVKINRIYPRTTQYGRTYGCYMIATEDGFITTSRGKNISDPVLIKSIDIEKRIIYSNAKATLNAPLLYNILRWRPGYNIVIHNHKQIPGAPTLTYKFPGTVKEASIASIFELPEVFNIENHGYIARFKSIEECQRWIDDNDKLGELP